MLIALMSDSHDHIAHMRLAIEACNDLKAGAVIHCGDLISPFMLTELARFKGPVHLVFGNNTGDIHAIANLCREQFAAITLHGSLGEVLLDGRRIAFTHLPRFARGLAMTEELDLVCCGHTHFFQAEWVGRTLLINCGELMGSNEAPGLVVFDSVDCSYERVTVARQW